MVRRIGKADMNAQDGTLQNVTGLPCGLGQSFCGLQELLACLRVGTQMNSPPVFGAIDRQCAIFRERGELRLWSRPCSHARLVAQR